MIIEEKDSERRRKLMEQWIRDNSSDISWKIDDIDHVIDCFESIYNWYEKGWVPGGFLTAVLKNDLKMACFLADHVNRPNLYLYAMFLHWHMPHNYIDRIKTLK